MSCYLYEIEFSALKGVGPDPVVCTIPITIDDVEPDVPESIVRDWAIHEAKTEMRRRGFSRFTLREVFTA